MTPLDTKLLRAKCDRLCRAASALGHANVMMMVDPSDVPAVRIAHHKPDYEICADPLKELYDVWSLSPRSLIRPDIALHDAATMLVTSYTQAKRKMMRDKWSQQGLTGRKLERSLDAYFKSHHNGHLGR